MRNAAQARGLVQRSATTITQAAREAGRWESVELDLVRMTTAALGLAVPFGWGLLSGHPGQGAAATIGALLVSSSGHAGHLAARVLDLVVGIAASAACLWIGILLSRHGGSGVGIPVIAGLLALAGPYSPVLAKAGVQGIVVLVLSPALSGPEVSTAQAIGWFALGGAFAGALTLAGHALAGRITHLRTPPEGGLPEAGRHARRLAAAAKSWRYPLSLALALGLAELAARIEDKPHATWIALTVVLVMQRDRTASANRAIQRALGTLLGTGLGALALYGLPDSLLIVMAAVIGAVRGHLKLANYTSYAVVMTPLVMIFLSAGRPIDSALLRERVTDTVIGCVIGFGVGRLPLTTRPQP